ncbi:hypothetical protein BCY91_04345 [Pelobium manganitolerans]|uniref:Uncharacterized protein n=1 Tax=Pelobium manganitolerans TaxID=1842495 RepID=A0A419S5J7_9SPHI|nr:hypothetical protein BCY91_04345 [Pelobium manganitolerans]
MIDPHYSLEPGLQPGYSKRIIINPWNRALARFFNYKQCNLALAELIAQSSLVAQATIPAQAC